MNKHIKKFEEFTNDEQRGEKVDMPLNNPAMKLKATRYVDDHYSGRDFLKLCDILGIDKPSEESKETFDQACDEIREKAIEYFFKNPEEMRETTQVNNFNVGGNDALPRVQNIGGTYTQGN